MNRNREWLDRKNLTNDELYKRTIESIPFLHVFGSCACRATVHFHRWLQENICAVGHFCHNCRGNLELRFTHQKFSFLYPQAIYNSRWTPSSITISKRYKIFWEGIQNRSHYWICFASTHWKKKREILVIPKQLKSPAEKTFLRSNGVSNVLEITLYRGIKKREKKTVELHFPYFPLNWVQRPLQVTVTIVTGRELDHLDLLIWFLITNPLFGDSW